MCSDLSSAASVAAPGAQRGAEFLAAGVRVDLPQLGVIRVEGADAATFLHAQLTNDMLTLAPDEMRQAGYCNVKGRLIATLHAWRDGDAIHLLLPREILPPVLKRLSMFVLRAKARLTEVSEQFRVAALLGPGAADKTRALVRDVPDQPWRLRRADDALAVRLPSSPRCQERWLLISAADAAADPQPLPSAGADRFWLTQIDAALPTVFAATQEKFVPQMINFELVGGVNFRKGCFPGQEVVARSQYLGKLRRRMAPARTDATDASVAPGADVFAAGETQPIGTVVMSAPSPQGDTELLFECPVDRLEGDLRVGSAQGATLQLRPLPYPIVDVTA